jgi:hypothetical protein
MRRKRGRRRRMRRRRVVWVEYMAIEWMKSLICMKYAPAPDLYSYVLQV